MSKNKLQKDMIDFAKELAQESFNKGYIAALMDLRKTLDNQIPKLEELITPPAEEQK